MYSDYFIGNQMMIKKKSLSMEVLIMEKYCMLWNLPASKDVTEERRQTIDFLHELVEPAGKARCAFLSFIFTLCEGQRHSLTGSV